MRQGTVDAGTFHAIARKLLRERPELAGLAPAFEVADETDSMGLLRPLVTARPELAEEIGATDAKAAAKEMAETIAAFKGEGMSPEEAAPLAGDETLAPRTRWAATLYPLYQAAPGPGRSNAAAPPAWRWCRRLRPGRSGRFPRKRG